jgi:aldose 1-epimerase
VAPTLITLTQSDFVVAVAPEIGASLARLSWRDNDLLRASGHAALAAGDPMQMACFPMAPWSNRIAAGAFRWEGRSVQLAPNFGRSPHAIHGQVWRRPWNVEDVAADRLVLSCKAGGDEWPWRYRAEFEVALTRQCVVLRLSVINTDRDAMPAWIGLHPYFPPKDAEIKFVSGRVWRTADELPVSETDVPSEWFCGESRPPPHVDHCFCDWNGQADVSWRRFKLRIAAQNARFLQVYAPEDGSALCLEPQTGAPDAVHLASRSGLAVLQPGERLGMSMTLAPEH